MKLASAFFAFTIALLGTYCLREFLGGTIAALIVFFLTNLGLAGIYYLQLRSGRKRSEARREHRS